MRALGHNPRVVNVPNSLSLVRLFLVPVLLTLAWNGQGRIFLIVLMVSLATDACDGWIARQFKQSSEIGARLDSWADFLTSISLPFCGWWLRPEVVRQEASFLVAGIFFYLAVIAIGFLKFRRLTSYHTWGGKVSAIVVAAAVIVFFANGPGWPFRIAMPIVILACLEEIAIIVVLAELRTNVPSLWHAWQCRRAPSQK